jgi:GR25 family glycosyltransferase involved in LPS biosynthesis
MKSYVITLSNDTDSVQGASRLIQSVKDQNNTFNIKNFEAVTPEQVDNLMDHYGIVWNWPWKSGCIDIQSGIYKQPYLTSNKNRRIACFLSHYSLWKECVSSNDSLMIFEHDSYVTRFIEWDKIEESRFDIIGMNDPHRSTRKSDLYHKGVQSQEGFCVDVPKIDADNIAQGLAGNSAYYIKPSGAKKLIALVDEYGAWPNDSIMCIQFMPGRLGQLKKYCTTVQHMVSTTSF